MYELTHASFFSGVGGLDLGLERAGWRTVSFSEIDPYASAVLAQRWPGVPNLGSIVDLADGVRMDVGPRRQPAGQHDGHSGQESASGRIPAATLWTGGFPCQDLSVAGKRRGMGEGTRSGLAYSFLALAERHRPRFILLENVPGLLSSHGGRDMAALLGALVELGYGVGYRVLDARYFGVPQRRRRVFILGDSLGGRAGAERASEVLSVGSRCRRHPPTGIEAGSEVAAESAGSVGSLSASGMDKHATQNVAAGHYVSATLDTSDGREGRDDGSRYVEADRPSGERPPGPGSQGAALGRDQSGSLRASGAGYPVSADDEDRLVIGPAADADRVRAADGLAGRLDDRGDVASYHQRDRVYGSLAPALDSYGDTGSDAPMTWATGDVVDRDDTLPLGLDSHRYRCCGNGVVSDVAEWIGRRLAEVA